MLSERDSQGRAGVWINDLLIEGADDALPVAVSADSTGLVDRTYVPDPVENSFQTIAHKAAVAVESTGNALPGMLGDISQQERKLISKNFKDLEKAIVSNIPNVNSTARGTASRMAGLMTYGHSGDAISLGTSGATAITNGGYDAATKLTAAVNDIKTDGEALRGNFSPPARAAGGGIALPGRLRREPDAGHRGPAVHRH